MKKIIFFLTALLFGMVSFAQETVTISPTWHQSFHYANAGGQTIWTVIGIVLVAGWAALIIINRGYNKSSTGIVILAWVMLTLGVASIMGKTSAVKWNNDKKVDKEYLQKVGEQHIWDSLENNCLIVDGPYKCK